MTVVAWDALVPIVNKNNPVSAISGSDLKKVLKGEITNWKDLGGPDLKILVIAREGKVSGVGYMTRRIIFGSADVEFASDALLVKSSGPLENKIQTDPAAIGITGISSAKKRIDQGKPLTILQVDGQKADVASISAGKYPTFRPLYLMTKGAPTGTTKDFIDWLLTTDGQKVIESVGTVSLKQGAGLKDKFKHWKNTDRILNFGSLK
jgi:phosphate transport system substrate-binding protein